MNSIYHKVPLVEPREILIPGAFFSQSLRSRPGKEVRVSILKSRKIPIPPLFPKREKVESSNSFLPKALLPLKKGGREGFLERPFQNTKALRKEG